jgi:hypothetical protein
MNKIKIKANFVFLPYLEDLPQSYKNIKMIKSYFIDIHTQKKCKIIEKIVLS